MILKDPLLVIEMSLWAEISTLTCDIPDRKSCAILLLCTAL